MSEPISRKTERWKQARHLRLAENLRFTLKKSLRKWQLYDVFYFLARKRLYKIFFDGIPAYAGMTVIKK